MKARRALQAAVRPAAAVAAMFVFGTCAGPAVREAPVVGPPAGPPPAPEWIWASEVAGDGESCYFRRSFELTEPVQAARLVATCDNHFVAYLNGVEVARGDEWTEPVTRDVAKALRDGVNVLAVNGRNDGGPAALLVRLDMRTKSGAVRRIASDGQWLASREETSDWQSAVDPGGAWLAAHSFGPAASPRGPWGHVFASAQATPAESLVVPDGFAAELLCSAQPGEGSWVCMAFDDRGRLVVSPQRGGLLRITLADDNGEPFVEPLDIAIPGSPARALGAAQGLLFVQRSLYVNVNRRPSEGGGLYRLRDRDGDDRFEDVQRLATYGPSSEHGAHAILRGADDKLWLLHGNMTDLPELSPASAHKSWAEEVLLPREWDPGGHAVGLKAPGAQVFRIDAEAEEWELVAAGMRNPYDMAFNADGELFTFDADMEWDVGAPWYRPTRIVHVVSGGEYGWRSGSAKWPAYYPDSLPAAVDIGVGSPVGVEFGTRSRFPGRYASALYVGDWAYGRILTVHLEPNGASYGGWFEEFARGKPLNVTDLTFGPDGAMYFITGGRGTQSGLYRVRFVGTAPRAGERASERAADSEAVAARALRRQLEAWHGRRDPKAIDAVWSYLGDRDRWIRYAARVAVEHQDVELWAERALAEPRTAAALEALLALARCGPVERQVAVLDRLGELQPSSLDRGQRLAWLRVHQLCFTRMGSPAPAVAARVIARLDPLYPAASDAENRELSQLLVYLEAPGVVDRTMELLASARADHDQMFFAFVLRHVAQGWTPTLRADYFEWIRNARNLEGGKSLVGYVERIEKAAREAMPEVVSTPIVRDEPVVPELVDTGAYHNWQMSELTGVLDQVGSGRSFASGKAAFTSALCATCHRFGGQGGAVGPDLTGAGSRFSRRDLLETILLPSKTISDQYQSLVVTKKSGEVVVGRLVGEDPTKLVLKVGVYGEQQVEIAAGDVVSREASDISAMPMGLVNGLTEAQILDLIAYIETGGDPNHAAFR